MGRAKKKVAMDESAETENPSSSTELKEAKEETVVDESNGAVAAPLPRKRGRPRKVVQESAQTVAMHEEGKPKSAAPENNSKKFKEANMAEENLPRLSSKTLNYNRREGSRRKGEPRRAAD